MLSKKANKNLNEMIDGGILTNETLLEILTYMHFYKREQYYIGRDADNKFFLFDDKPSVENFVIYKQDIITSLETQ